jgi:general secretion pathway protein J
MMARRRQKRSSVAGFTLIEAVVAMALMAMILVALATITTQWMPNWNRGLTRVQRDADLALGLDRLVADLAAAEFIPANRQTLKPYFDGGRRSVTFVRTILSPNAQSGLELVRFSEVGSAEGSALVRMQAPFLPAGERNNGEEPHFSNPVAVISSPYRISFSYAGADRIWHETWQYEMLLPKAVRLTVDDTRTGRVLAASTATLVHVAIPADCVSAKSLAQCVTSLRPGTGTAANSMSPETAPGQRL